MLTGGRSDNFISLICAAPLMTIPSGHIHLQHLQPAVRYNQGCTHRMYMVQPMKDSEGLGQSLMRQKTGIHCREVTNQEHKNFIRTSFPMEDRTDAELPTFSNLYHYSRLSKARIKIGPGFTFVGM